MQHPVRSIPRNRYRFAALFASGAGTVALLVSLFATAGCDAPPPATDSRRAKPPLDGVSLALSCPDAAFADALAPMTKAWAARTGATVTINRTAMTATDATDLAVIPAGALGEWGEAGALVPVPAKVKTGEQLQWQGLFPVYADRFAEWGGQTLAVPLTGDGHVLVYRADRFAEGAAAAEFQKRHNRPLAAPATWEEFAAVAAFFADRDKKPSLPPLPADPDRLFDLFGRVAASADRRAIDEQGAKLIANDPDALAFQFSVATGKPRIQARGFRFAAGWLDRLRAAGALPAPAPGASDDPVAALAEGRAVLALVSLDQLARLPRENGVVPARFGIAGVPGTRESFDAIPPKLTPGTELPLNYVPYLAGGRLGVVRARCPHPDAAFDLLAELGGPARGAELVGTPGLGAGPLRGAHLNRDRLLLWLGYGFDEERSRQLQDALRHCVDQGVKNPVLALRGPDRAALVGAAADPLRKLATGAVPAADALKQIEDAWNALDAKVPPDKLILWRRRAAGLN